MKSWLLLREAASSWHSLDRLFRRFFHIRSFTQACLVNVALASRPNHDFEDIGTRRGAMAARFAFFIKVFIIKALTYFYPENTSEIDTLCLSCGC